ncbi:MAG: hypothetical protein AUJ98_02830 [Bacteroidetes bacterium CG2_30_33_31]|nr:MAG: hypothetical protein AUJ98_02830 [Bacteroidetes bacterium CG2_30_33_31]
MKKVFKVSIYTFVIVFALLGFGLTSAYLAIKFHLTDDPGAVDYNDRLYKELANNDYHNKSSDSLAYFTMQNNDRAEDYMKIMLIGKFYPYNANLILNAVNNSNDPTLADKLIAAIDFKLSNNADYISLLEKAKNIYQSPIKLDTVASVFDWMNISEWSDLKIAITKDKKLIDSAASLAGVESRIIVCCLIGEQIRLFNSKREIYKTYISPLKVLSVESQFSLGVVGVKDFTAVAIEQNLKDTSSVFYLGEKYEHVLDFETQVHETERYSRLTSFRDHFYQYLYSALYLKEVQNQWKTAKYDISNRPEILTTLYNVGFKASIPKGNPKVGGSKITIHDKNYTFGGICFDFYYSGELAKEFPYLEKKFWD